MKYRRWVVLGVGIALLVAACSSGAEETTTSTSTTFPTETTAAATTSTPATTSSTTTTSTTSPHGIATLLTAVIQQELQALGHFYGEPDGILGPVTEEALREFQTEAGITVDGEYGPQTYDALAEALEQNADFVERFQKDLTELGLYKGPIDGDYGSGTVKAVEKLQEECDRTIAGRLDPWTHVCLEQQLGNG
ncbi:MAG: peptidoglycan-binding domain-containing protein [Actinomycetota bacterium]